MYSPKEFKITKTNLVYDHFLRVRQDLVQTPNGNIVDYNYVDAKNDAVIVLPIQDGKIVMLRQYRYPIKKYVYDLPAGGIELGKTKLAAAKDELKEETGYIAKKIRYINSFYHVPGMSNSTVHAYLATDLARGETDLEKSEFAEVILVSISKFEKLLLTKKIESTIAATYLSAKLKKLI